MGVSRNGWLVVAACLCATMLSNCARPSTRIASELQAQGFEPSFARCVGTRMEQRLSVTQLVRLRDALRDYRARVGGSVVIDFGALMAMMQQIGDPQIPLETFGAGLSCGVH